MTDTPSFFLPDGDGVVGTHRTQGTWHPEHMHGSPVQALMARAVEQVPSLVPMQVTRLTHDMVRPAPIGPTLRVETAILREGKKIQLVEAILKVGDVEHVRTTALRLRVHDASGARIPTSSEPVLAAPPPVDEVQPMAGRIPAGFKIPGFVEGVELRRFNQAGRPEGTLGFWVRARVPLLPDEPLTPLQRLALAGDLANTIGVTIDPTAATTINPDVTISVLRPPVDEWVAVIGSTTFCPERGVGLSTAELHDRDGIVGGATVTQLVEGR